MNRQRILRFSLAVFATYRLPHDKLVRIARSKRLYSSYYRAAALRHLVADAPLSVTGGRPFAERRRRVRAHYGI
ncbi:hypothetical protein [Paraburkholderia sp. BCC1876]|uniref:hypothetical protein n=1 Tax=Paraburkholderia sp. BCC1876 TaxID=2676303 RepID=UPI0015910961|nr:hypothetical protein [Paraburkholderia sp. BCC1876]